MVVGIAFGAGWTPVHRPDSRQHSDVRGDAERVSRGLVLLGAYSLGLAIPFVLAAVAVERFLAVFQRVRAAHGLGDRVSGAVLVVVGVLMLTDYMTVLTELLLQGLTPAALRNRL